MTKFAASLNPALPIPDPTGVNQQSGTGVTAVE